MLCLYCLSVSCGDENNKEIYKINVTVDEDVERANILELLLRNIKDIMTGENIM